MPVPRFPPDERRNLRDLDRRIRAAAQLPGRRIAMVQAPDAFAVAVTDPNYFTTHIGVTYRQGVTITATLLVTIPAGTSIWCRLMLDPPADQTGPTSILGDPVTDLVVEKTISVPVDWEYNTQAMLRLEAKRVLGTGTGLIRLLRVIQR
jgi:hypothetical protein